MNQSRLSRHRVPGRRNPARVHWPRGWLLPPLRPRGPSRGRRPVCTRSPAGAGQGRARSPRSAGPGVPRGPPRSTDLGGADGGAGGRWGTLPATPPSPATADPPGPRSAKFPRPIAGARPGRGEEAAAARPARPAVETRSPGVARPPKLVTRTSGDPVGTQFPPWPERPTAPAPARTGAGTVAGSPHQAALPPPGQHSDPVSHLRLRLPDSLTSQPLLLRPAARPPLPSLPLPAPGSGPPRLRTKPSPRPPAPKRPCRRRG